jgi:hypothetical protein
VAAAALRFACVHTYFQVLSGRHNSPHDNGATAKAVMVKHSKPEQPLFDPDWLPLLRKFPREPVAPEPSQPTQRQQVVLAIVKRRYPKGIPASIQIAALHRLVEQEWEAECARQKLPQLLKAVSGRDMVAYTLRAASLIS